MSVRKKIPLITADATLNIDAGHTLDISGGNVSIVGTGVAVVTFPASTSTLATLALAETLTNKTVDLTDNTVTGTKAEFNTACSDGDFLYDGDVTVPVKAIGSELDTGTDDAKFATALALADSKYFKSDEVITISNKRITSRVATFTTDATPDVNSDNYDSVTITAQDAAITDVNMSGTPTNFQKITFRFKDDGTARAITWGSDFEDAGTALPTTTVISKLLTVGFIYNSVSAKWGCVAVANQT